MSTANQGRLVSVQVRQYYTTTVSLTPEQSKWLRDQAYQNGMSQSSIMRELIDQEMAYQNQEPEVDASTASTLS